MPLTASTSCCSSICRPIPLAERSNAAESCAVWIAAVDELRPEHEGLLDGAERERAGTFARQDDRSRFVLGAVLLKLAVAVATGQEPGDVVVDRECDQCGQQHGRPRARGLGVHVSVAHSGSVVAVSLTRLAPVGVDVEAPSGAPDPMLVRRVLAPTEKADAAPAFLTYWCRKESVVKATGDGLRVPLTEVIVTAPDEPPSLVSYRGAALAATLFDLDVGERGYAAALAVLTAERVQLVVDRADRLLRR